MPNQQFFDGSQVGFPFWYRLIHRGSVTGFGFREVENKPAFEVGRPLHAELFCGPFGPFYTQHFNQFILCPRKIVSLFKLTCRRQAVGVRCRVKRPLRRGHVPVDVFQHLFHDLFKGRVPGHLVPIQIRHHQQCIVIQHFFKVRDEPFFIRGITVKSSPGLIVNSSRSHFFKGCLGHLKDARFFRTPVIPQQQADWKAAGKFGGPGHAAVGGIKGFAVNVDCRME